MVRNDSIHGDVRLSTEIDLSQTAIWGLRCLPIDPSSATICANNTNAGENATVAKLKRLFASATPVAA